MPHQRESSAFRTLTATTHEQARLLFVVSKDFGCLGMALAFVQGHELGTRAVLLLPGDIHAINKHALPAPSAAYATLSDVLAAVDAHKPDIVFLVSGYLFSNDDLLSDEALTTLVQQLRDRDCRIVTADPFIGLAPRLKRADVDGRLLFLKHSLRERLIGRFHFWRSRHERVVTTRALEDVVHVYPAPTRHLDTADSPHRVSFFNRELMRPHGTSHESFDSPNVGSGPTGLPATWLFIISSVDLGVQEWLLGAPTFDTLVVDKLTRTLEAGRRPILIAPSSLIARLGPELSRRSDVELLSRCSYEDYVTRLLNAEYVFYWNAFSFSLFLRLSQGRPAFFFDPGHLPRVIKPYYALAKRLYYDTWSPPYLDQRRHLDPSQLTMLAEQQKPELAKLVAYWSSSPPPAAVVDELLERPNP